MVGVTFTETPVAVIGLQVNDVAPKAVSVELRPGQTDAGEAESVNVGSGFTVTEATAEPVQPAVVPTTVKVVFAVGLRVIEAPVKFPGFQVNVVAPFAVRVTAAPIQIAVGLAPAKTVGLETTTCVAVTWAVHPDALVPITV